MYLFKKKKEIMIAHRRASLPGKVLEATVDWQQVTQQEVVQMEEKESPVQN